MFTPQGDGISYLDTVNDIATYGIYMRGYLVMLATVDQASPAPTLVVRKPGVTELANVYDTKRPITMTGDRASSTCVRVAVFSALPLLLQAIHDPDFAKHLSNGADPLMGGGVEVKE